MLYVTLTAPGASRKIRRASFSRISNEGSAGIAVRAEKRWVG
jgi:hypothetical protein